MQEVSEFGEFYEIITPQLLKIYHFTDFLVLVQIKGKDGNPYTRLQRNLRVQLHGNCTSLGKLSNA